MPDSHVLIIREFLAADGDFVSGSELAELIGVSRVSVWSYMEKLKAQGFDFEAVRSKGYRLTKVPEELNQALIQSRLQHAAEHFRAIVLDEVDSTNSEAERLIANGEEAPFVVISRLQTIGRGRLGRIWHSPQNGNLYASFGFRPQISPTQMSLFTLWMGINICECINSICRVNCQVKWPNDLHIEGKKVAGILTEARMEADQVLSAVLGLGLNVNSDGSDWPAELKEIATSLRQSAGQSFDINKLVSAITGRIAIAYKQLADGSHRAALKERWPIYDTLAGKKISLIQGENRISGIARGIDTSGALVVEKEDGARFLARAGEVTIEK
ncbi:biotin--[acetyl-CoA-carboxylase] ligase [Pelagicoccus sp. SDUM812005]|uniref:biotin--[acetyl-CoA-carboxylase] ligase n=1 Tax=Pelagicoccus sp. SDUM812005 TaxID=3041257 RepID=UPI00280D2D33|nr:biotin--[acetyl-CoA-carboxylase] ligase [Pelagicoccus sp. SDUM812005]MDQ8183229.1 biotin--[acetyl-CoA-carboxylase] ligase [Pelagicoccus sp. SDUM812005]